LLESEARLAVATRELEEAQAKLDEKEAELRQVQELYDAAMAEKQVSHIRAMWLDSARVRCRTCDREVVGSTSGRVAIKLLVLG